MGKFLDITGKKYGRLTVLRRGADLPQYGYAAQWICRCDCGTIKSVDGRYLRTGQTHSCGCWKKEFTQKMAAQARRKHGRSHDSMYRLWSHMIERCCSPDHKSFKYYGGRGISICAHWRNSFLNFTADMGERPKGLTIERVDVNQGYSKNNCRWATTKEQSLNKRNTPYLTAFGETKPLFAWFEDPRCSITYAALRKRLKVGLCAEEAVSKPAVHPWGHKK